MAQNFGSENSNAEIGLSDSLKSQGITLLKEIGRGNQSIVFDAECDGETRALKIPLVISQERRDDSLQSFRREAGLLGRLKSESLVEIVELGMLGRLREAPYLLMEQVRGQSLRNLVLKNVRPDEEQVLKWAKSLARALSLVHEQGVVHRDIKPENILITESGSAKLIDFGFATHSGVQDPLAGVAGTFLYISPEQTGALKRPIDGRSDLYSLGIVLFECFTGSPPFQMNQVSELIRSHLTIVPPNVKELNPSVSPAVGLIIKKLLAKDPDDRYQSGRGLVKDFEKIATFNENLKKGLRIVLDAEQDIGTVDTTPLFGRDVELGRLNSLTQALRNGAGSSALIEGEPGAGKSRLVREFLGKMHHDPSLVLRGKCNQGDPRPFAPIRQALEEHSRIIQRKPELAERSLRAMGDAAPLFLRIAPSLSSWVKTTVDVSKLDVPIDQFSQVIADFIANLASVESPVILFVDDIQWLDDASKQVFIKLLDGIDSKPVLVCLAARSDMQSRDAVGKFVAALRSPIRLTLPLGPLASEGIHSLIQAYLGPKPVEPTLVDQVSRRSEGHPFATGEYLRAMLEAGVLRLTRKGWIADSAGIESLRLPTDVIQLVIKRIDELESTTKSIFVTAAVLGSRIKLKHLPEICEATPAEIYAAIAEATQAHLVERDESGMDYNFVHDRVREALLATLKTAELTKKRQRIAEILDSLTEDRQEWLYDIAQHYAQGTRSNLEKVFSANFEAAKKAVEDYAWEEAYSYFKNASQAAQEGSISVTGEFEERFGALAAATGRGLEAIAHFESAMPLVKTRDERLSLWVGIARVHIGRLQVEPAKQAVKKAFAELGRSYPSTLKWLPAMIGGIAASAFFEIFKIRFKPLDAKTRSKIQTKLALYNITGYIGFFEFDTLLFIAGGIKQLIGAHRIGKAPAASDAFVVVGVDAAVLLLSGVSSHYGAKSLAIAEDLGDPSVIAHSRGFDAIRECFGGDDRSGELKFRNVFAQYFRWMAIDDRVNCGGIYIWNLLLRGYARESITQSEKILATLETGQDQKDSAPNQFQSWHLAFGMTSLAMLGRRTESFDFLKRFETSGINIPYHLGIFYVCLLGFHLENEEYGESAEEVIRKFNALGTIAALDPIPIRQMYVNEVLLRLEQAHRLKIKGDRQLKSIFGKLRRALGVLFVSGLVPGFRSYYFLGLGGLKRLQGRFKAAERCFHRASLLAHEVDAPVALYEIARQRAFLWRAKGNELAAQKEALNALVLAQKNGWIPKEKKIRNEFNLSDSMTRYSSDTPNVKSTMLLGGPSAQGFNLQAQLDALMRVSLAVCGMTEAKAQTRSILDEIVSILNADRAFLFLLDGNNQSLITQAGRSSDHKDILSLTGYSSTVVEKVRETRKPLVVSGTEEGAILGSESAVVNDLRSIMSAPLFIGQRMIGVIYIDSRVAKGFFSEGDVEILLALARHIAVVIETSRAARLEIEQKALEKELEITGAVQQLLLPIESEFKNSNIELSALYRPANQSGGDWWWFEERDDGSILGIVGDVSGHGAGSAMMTAAIASIYRNLQLSCKTDDIVSVLKTLNDCLRSLSRGKYWMTMAIVLIQPNRQIDWWVAGAPPLFIYRASSGTIASLTALSTPLGADDSSQLAHIKDQIYPGDRVLLFSDGMFDFETRNGARFGMRNLKSTMLAAQKLGTKEAKEFIASKVQSQMPNQTLPDDMTFILFSCLK